MKIGFVLDDTLDSYDGVQQYVLTLGEWLTQHNHQVHYLVGQTNRSDIKNVHSLAKNFKVKFNKNVLSIPFLANNKDIKELLDKEQFDVLHVQLPYSPFLAGKIINNKPDITALVGTFHILPFSKLQQIGARQLARFTRNSTIKFNEIVSVSPPAKEFAESSMSIKSSVLPNAVNISKYSEGSKLDKYRDGKQNVVFLGRLVKRKGCLELLKAIKQLRDNSNFNDCRLIIAGTGPDEVKLKKYVKQNNLQDSVEFLGRVSEDTKTDLLASADIVALPSISGESFGIVIVEAIAAGAGVVIGGNNPGYSFVLKDTPETLFDPYNTKVCADILSDLLSNKQKRMKLNKIQRSRIKEFDVNLIGKQLLGIYKSAIAKQNIKSDN